MTPLPWSAPFRYGGFLQPSAERGGPAGQGACQSENSAPSLRWYNVPAGTKSFTLTITDVDAQLAAGFCHWVACNIPANHPWLYGHGQNPFSEGTDTFGATSYGLEEPTVRSAEQPVHHFGAAP